MLGTVFVCEGEKDTDNVRKLGLIATCNVGGAAEHKDASKPYRGKWHPAWSEYLRGRDVVILADNDTPGEAHADDVATKLTGIAASIKVLKLPNLPPKGDVSDWIASGGSRNELLALADAASPVSSKERRPSRAPVNILALVTHITTTAAWDGVLKFNQLTENYEICGPFPPKDGPKEPPRPVRDPHDILLATMYFQANGFPKAGKNVVWDALAAVAHEHGYHPVRDYLNPLHWDGTERVGSLFRRYFSAEMPEDERERDRLVAYLEHIGTSFMVGAVARVMEPGCKHDHVPVVNGHQGMFKSTAIRALCHDPTWFTDNIPPDLTDRDTKESLVGKWIVELAEIPHVRRDAERLKAFVSSSVDRYRSPYGLRTQDHPRQCVFIGTSNDLEFVDVTGNRRFWPFVSAGQIDLDAIVHDRDQLWAEAVALYRQGVRWWLPPNIEKIAAEQQEAFVEADIWEGIIATWLENRSSRPFTMEDLFAKDTGITPNREAAAVSKADEMRAGRCLKKLKWHKSRCTLNAKRAVWWIPDALPG